MPLPAKTFEGVEGDFEASKTGESMRARSAECQDHPRSAPDHMPGGRPGSQEVRPHCRHDGPSEILNRSLGQRLLDVSVRDEVERDIYGAGLLDHPVDIFVNNLLVEG